MNWQEFFAMGGHAFFVWSSYGAVAVVMLYHCLVPVLRHSQLLRDIRQQLDASKGKGA